MSEHSPPGDGRRHTAATQGLKGAATTTNNASALHASSALSQLHEGFNETNYPMQPNSRKMTYISHSYLPQATSSRPYRNVGTAVSSSRNNLLGAVTGDMDIQVKGKSSIRTLIRLANSRALSERGGGAADDLGNEAAKGEHNVSIDELNSADSGDMTTGKSLVKATVTAKVRKSID